MKICDRHGTEKPITSRYSILVEQEGQEIELCSECYLEFMEWVTSGIKTPKNKGTLSLKRLVGTNNG